MPRGEWDPKVAHRKARTAALAKQPIKLWEERVAGEGPSLPVY
jgi:hypothetical protein